MRAVTLQEAAVAGAAGVVATYVLAWVTRPASDGAVRLARFVNTPVAVALLAGAAVWAMLTGVAELLVILALYFLGRGIKAWLEWRQGGITLSGLAIAFAVFAYSSSALLGGLREAVLK